MTSSDRINGNAHADVDVYPHPFDLLDDGPFAAASEQMLVELLARRSDSDWTLTLDGGAYVLHGPFDQQVRLPDGVELEPDLPSGRGHHGPRMFAGGCRCRPCCTGWVDALSACALRCEGLPAREIGEMFGVSREAIRLRSEMVAPWAPWQAAAVERQTVAEEAEQVRRLVAEQRPCRVCGAPLGRSKASVINCSDACARVWDRLAYHADPHSFEVRGRARQRWLEANRDVAPDWARELDGCMALERSRFLVVGSQAWDAAVTAWRNDWPIVDELPESVVAQIERRVPA